MIRKEITDYVQQHILPRYDTFDRAHRRDHALTVIEQSAELAQHYEVEDEMVYVVAAYHDVGLCGGRDKHHTQSAQIIMADENLRQWFSQEQIKVMAEAAEDHRASAASQPRSIYGRIVAEADRVIEPMTILRRTVQYGLAHYAHLSKEEHWQRLLEHMAEKYAEGGYLKLWIPESSNTSRLQQLREIISDKKQLRILFEQIFEEEISA